MEFLPGYNIENQHPKVVFEINDNLNITPGGDSPVLVLILIIFRGLVRLHALIVPKLTIHPICRQ